MSAALVLLSIPVLKCTLGRFLADVPGGLKTHNRAAPMLGGCAIFIATVVTLVFLRFTTNFPTGTLHSLRGILGAGTLIFALGLTDDLRKPKGLPIWVRLAVQTAAACLLIYYGVYVQIFDLNIANYAVTFVWLVGLTNAFNLLDIADGLCISQALICTAGLFLIALPGDFRYVNLAAITLLGACATFWPFNHAREKIFLGDSGATFLGFFIAALTMGVQYSRTNPYGYAAALFITAVPLLDTAFVTTARLLQGKNPLKGSNDHLALLLKNKRHCSNETILCLFGLTAIAANIWAYTITRINPIHTPTLCLWTGLGAGMFLLWLLQKLHTSIR